jgi:hypothetical protein
MDFFFDFVLGPIHMARHVVSGIWRERPPGLEWALAGLAGSHAVSFVYNFIRGGERTRLTVGNLMVHPYLRAFLGTIVVLVGGWAYERPERSPGLAALCAIVLFKLGADIVSYFVIHRGSRDRRQRS